MRLRLALIAWAGAVTAASAWRCPSLDARPAAECSCDLPRTLRCTGDHTALQVVGIMPPGLVPPYRMHSVYTDIDFTNNVSWTPLHLPLGVPVIGRHLKDIRASTSSNTSGVTLLDCALRGVTVLMTSSVSELGGSSLHGLVVSSGDLRRIQQGAFKALSDTLQALGLPNNQLPSIPTESLQQLYQLDRLDLSNNRIKVFASESFKGLVNLTFLDAGDNQVKSIENDSFKSLRSLRILRLRGNQLNTEAMTSLKDLSSLTELDLAANSLSGPLGPNTIPGLKCLKSLQLADNKLTSIRRGCLAGLRNLTFLGLHNNQIDVIEDHAFRQLANLTELDLSHNEIVAISGNSLAHLSRLERLDLSHNFLRSVGAEPLRALVALADVRLHDNDVSMVDEGALNEHRALRRLTMYDNPLNCDCLLAGFAKWLREAKNLSAADIAAPICATPPHLEGALLFRLSKSKLCEEADAIPAEVPIISTNRFSEQFAEDGNDFSNETNLLDLKQNQGKYTTTPVEWFRNDRTKGELIFDDKKVREDSEEDETDEDYEVGDSDELPATAPYPLDDNLPISKSKINLSSFSYDGLTVKLRWVLPGSADVGGAGGAGGTGGAASVRYACDALFVYERVGSHERLLAAEPLRCGAEGAGAGAVEVAVPGSRDLVPGKSYRYCLVLLEDSSSAEDVALVLGCTEHIVLRETTAGGGTSSSAQTTIREVASNVRVSGVRSNVTQDGTLSVEVSLFGYPPNRPQNLQISRPEHLLTKEEAQYFNTLNNCYVVLAVFAQGSLIAQRTTQCERTSTRMEGFLQGPYKVCATMSEFQVTGPHSMCVSAQKIEKEVSDEIKSVGFRGLNLALVGVTLGLLSMIVGLAWTARKILRKPKELITTHQCFGPDQPVEEGENQHSRYVKLQATSKV